MAVANVPPSTGSNPVLTTRLNIETFVNRLSLRKTWQIKSLSYLHKDTISNDRCVVPLRKEYKSKRDTKGSSTTQMSSQLDPTLGLATQADAACMKEGAKNSQVAELVDANELL